MLTFRAMTSLACAFALTAGGIATAQTERDEVRIDPTQEIRLVSEMIGASVLTSDRDEDFRGDINDIVFDQDGKPLMVIVGIGGVAGIAEAEAAVPVASVKVGRTEGENWMFSIDHTADQLRNAPKIEGEYTRLNDPTWCDANKEYFEVAEAREADAPAAATTVLIRGNELIGSDVENLAGEKIADVSDIVLNENYQAAYVILGAGGFLGIGQDKIAAPFDRMTIAADADFDSYTAALDTTKESLEQAPRLESGDYAVLLDNEYQTRVHEYYPRRVTPATQPED